MHLDQYVSQMYKLTRTRIFAGFPKPGGSRTLASKTVRLRQKSEIRHELDQVHLPLLLTTNLLKGNRNLISHLLLDLPSDLFQKELPPSELPKA